MRLCTASCRRRHAHVYTHACTPAQTNTLSREKWVNVFIPRSLARKLIFWNSSFGPIFLKGLFFFFCSGLSTAALVSRMLHWHTFCAHVPTTSRDTVTLKHTVSVSLVSVLTLSQQVVPFTVRLFLSLKKASVTKVQHPVLMFGASRNSLVIF